MEALAEQAVELEARRAPDALESTAFRADHDRLLTGTVHPDDGRHRLASVLLDRDLLDLHRHTVRQLLHQLQRELLADGFGDAKRLAAVGQLIEWEHRLPERQRGDDHAAQIIKILALAGRDRHARPED